MFGDTATFEHVPAPASNEKKDKSMNKVNWLTYEFDVYPPNTTWNDVPGIYIFAGLNAAGRWRAYYIGQAKSFKDRLSNHDQ